MRINYLKSGILFGCLIIFSSCNQNSTALPKVTFITPVMGQEIDPSKQLIIEADLSDDFLIDRYDIWLSSESGLELFHENLFVNSDTYTLKYTLDLSSTSYDHTCNIKITVVDSDGNKTSKKIQIQAKK